MSTIQIICCVVAFMIAAIPTLSILSQASQYDDRVSKLLKQRNRKEKDE